MLRFILTGLLACGITSTTALANDASAAFVTRLFVNACVPNVGKAENVRAWALRKKLAGQPGSLLTAAETGSRRLGATGR